MSDHGHEPNTREIGCSDCFEEMREAEVMRDELLKLVPSGRMPFDGWHTALSLPPTAGVTERKPDTRLVCDTCRRFAMHRFQPSPDAGPHWRCSECGGITEFNPPDDYAATPPTVSAGPDPEVGLSVETYNALIQGTAELQRRLDDVLKANGVSQWMRDAYLTAEIYARHLRQLVQRMRGGNTVRVWSADGVEDALRSAEEFLANEEAALEALHKEAK